MSVYIDSLRHYPYTSLRHKTWCHMLADTEEELHEMAKKIDLRRGWFQNKSIPHYDLTPSKRRLAIQYGAIELSRDEFVAKMREIRNS